MATPSVEYRDVPDYPGYRVGTDGSVWSHWRHSGRHTRALQTSWRLLRGCYNEDGYRQVTLITDRGKQTLRVGRLVLEAFVGPCPPDHEMCHGPQGKRDDSLTNLEWGTRLKNAADKIRDGIHRYGERMARAKLTDERVRIARRADKSEIPQLAREWGCTDTAVRSARNRRTWKHVT